MPSLLKIRSLLKVVDRLILQLASKRLFLARLVAFEKKKTDEPIFRTEIEDQRLGEARSYAKEIGMNPNFAHMIMYSLINESCKQQMILLQNEKSVDLAGLNDDVRLSIFKDNLLELNTLISQNIEKFSNQANPTLDSYLETEDKLLHKAASLFLQIDLK